MKQQSPSETDATKELVKGKDEEERTASRGFTDGVAVWILG